jgi:hypothetical protein
MARENFSNLLCITEPEGLDKIFWEDNLLSAVSFQPGLLPGAAAPLAAAVLRIIFLNSIEEPL